MTQATRPGSADDILLASPALIGHVTWRSFYNLDNPPADETIRLRFYDARNDGLPGDVIYEESVVNLPRAATGRVVFVSVLPHEYRYEADLAVPVSLAANTPYWLEIAQIGDPSTFFLWEHAHSVNRTAAFINPYTVDWRLSVNYADIAFQLVSIPEPVPLLLLACGIAVIRRRTTAPAASWRSR